MRALFIAAGAVGAAAAVTATVLVSAGGSAPAASRPAGLHLYIGNGDTTPVQRPDVIHTARGDIMVGEGKLPPGYGLSGTDYPGWYWTPGNAQLTWANLNNSDTVIQNVKTDPLGVGNVVTLTGGGKTIVCLSYQVRRRRKPSHLGEPVHHVRPRAGGRLSAGGTASGSIRAAAGARAGRPAAAAGEGMTGAISVPVTAASRGGRRDRSAPWAGRRHQGPSACSSGALKRVMYHHSGCPRGDLNTHSRENSPKRGKFHGTSIGA